ncbi:hypothetical protein B6D60_02030 [candidate division KSB1 bacterium 4484_87]|nr:MAG: hypothetical protein B6D60_02030 [candidate division KSB1 bacterium 4484_87]
MKTRITLVLSTIFLFNLLLLSCGSQKMLTEGEERKLSKGNQPEWVNNYKIKNTKDKRAVVGVSKNYAMESSARSDAILQAQKEAITLISSRISRSIKEGLASEAAAAEIVEEGAVKKDLTDLFTEGVFEGEVDQFYIEKFEKMVGGVKKHYYKAYVLLLYPRNLAKISAQKILAMKKAKETDQKRKNLIQKAEDLVNQANFDW